MTAPRWIQTNGGSHVLIPNVALRDWSGVDAALGGRSDYDRACAATDDWLGLTDLGKHQVLVINGDPLTTSWLPHSRWRDGVLVRLMWEHSAEQIAERLELLTSDFPSEFTVDLTVPKGGLVLIDSSDSGSEMNYVVDVLDVPISKGSFRVTTHVVRRDYEVGLVFHIFSRVS